MTRTSQHQISLNTRRRSHLDSRRGVRLRPRLETLEDRVTLSVAVDFTGITDAEPSVYDQTLGWKFSPTSEIVLNKLGFYDYGDDGLAQSHDVGVWDSTGNLLVSTTIGGGDLYNQFLYISVANTPLHTGHTYTIGATYYQNGPDQVTADVLGMTTNSITHLGRYWQHGTGLILPTNYGGERGYFGPNFQFTAATDLAATSLTWDTAQNGVDFGYQVNDAALPQDTSAAFYWASGTTEDTILEPAATPIPILSTTPVGQPQTIHVDQQDLQSAPPDAKYLLAKLDPNNTIAESDETNNIAFVAYDPIKMDSATSPNSRTIRFSYDISEAEPGQPITVGIYRSNNATFDGTAIKVDEQTIPPQDSNGGDSEAVGPHTVDIQDPGALLPDPRHEYVFVVADPEHNFGEPDGVYHEAHYRKFVVGVLAHGFQLLGGVSGVPQWETQAASDLLFKNSYDLAIPFDWSSTSNLRSPNLAVAAGDRLSQEVVSDADALVQQLGNPGDVVDLHFIGHSRGAVVISQALLDLLGTSHTVLAGGFKIMTMLDPHPANNGFALLDYSASKAGNAFVVSYRKAQEAMQDPQVIIPPNVDEAQEYYQHTPVSSFSGVYNTASEAYLNLWGEDPSLIINDSLATLEIHPLTAVVDHVLGPIGHSEVPFFYLLYDLPQENNNMYQGSGSFGHSSTISMAVASRTLSSPANGAQANNRSLSGARLNGSSLVQTGGDADDAPWGGRSVPDAIVELSSAAKQIALPALILALNDANTGQTIIDPLTATAPSSQALVESLASARRLRSARWRPVMSLASAGQSITKPLVSHIKHITMTKSKLHHVITRPPTSIGKANDARATDRPIGRIKRWA
jgi:hypothetical protein